MAVRRDCMRSCRSCFFAYQQVHNGTEYPHKRVEVRYVQEGDALRSSGIEIMNASRKVDLTQIQPVNFEIVG